MSEVIDLIRLRADEDEAWKENNVRDHRYREALRERYQLERDLVQAVKEVNDVFEGVLTVEPSDLYPNDRPRWRRSWIIMHDDLPLDIPFEARMNVFCGVRLMNGENEGPNDSGGPGRIINSLADLAEPLREAGK